MLEGWNFYSKFHTLLVSCLHYLHSFSLTFNSFPKAEHHFAGETYTNLSYLYWNCSIIELVKIMHDLLLHLINPPICPQSPYAKSQQWELTTHQTPVFDGITGCQTKSLYSWPLPWDNMYGSWALYLPQIKLSLFAKSTLNVYISNCYHEMPYIPQDSMHPHILCFKTL